MDRDDPRRVSGSGCPRGLTSGPFVVPPAARSARMTTRRTKAPRPRGRRASARPLHLPRHSAGFGTGATGACDGFAVFDGGAGWSSAGGMSFAGWSLKCSFTASKASASSTSCSSRSTSSRYASTCAYPKSWSCLALAIHRRPDRLVRQERVPDGAGLDGDSEVRLRQHNTYFTSRVTSK